MTAQRVARYRMAYRHHLIRETRVLDSLWSDLESLWFYARYYSQMQNDLEFFAVDTDGNPVPDPVKESDSV